MRRRPPPAPSRLRTPPPDAAPAARTYGGSTAIVAVAGLIAWGVSRLATIPHVSVVFLCAVLASAVRWGRGPGLFAAALSVALSSFFFYPPIYSFGVDNRQDLLDLVIFSIAALLASTLANEVRRQRIAAERHDAMTAELYAFSRRVAGIADLDELLRAVVETVANAAEREVALVLSAPERIVVSEGTALDAPGAATLRAAMEQARREDAGSDGATAAADPPARRWRFWWLHRDGAPPGALAVAGPALDDDRAELLDAMSDQVAIAIERAELATAVADARVRARTEELREALLNSVSHDLRTPLAAIIGSATSLQSFGSLEHRQAETELLATIREEAERLHHFIGNVLDLTRIRAGEIHPRLEMVEVADIVNAALRRAERCLAEHRVEVDLPGDLPMARLDLFLTEQALVNLLENAAKYSPPGSRIRVTARAVDGELVVAVGDQGPGIAPDEQAKIFRHFYRIEMPDPKPAGTGLGLAICRAFVEAQHGRVEVASGNGHGGTRFSVCFPLSGDPDRESELGDE